MNAVHYTRGSSQAYVFKNVVVQTDMFHPAQILLVV